MGHNKVIMNYWHELEAPAEAKCAGHGAKLASKNEPRSSPSFV